MEKEELKRIVVEASFEDGDRRKFACPQAFKIAAEHGAKLGDIGDVCNEENIRIIGCQLGCFE